MTFLEFLYKFLVLLIEVLELLVVLFIPGIRLILKLFKLQNCRIFVILSFLIQLSQIWGMNLLEVIIGIFQFLQLVSVLLICIVKFLTNIFLFLLVTNLLIVILLL